MLLFSVMDPVPQPWRKSWGYGGAKGCWRVCEGAKLVAFPKLVSHTNHPHPSAPLCSSTHFSTLMLLHTLQHPFAPPHTSAPLCSSTQFSPPLLIHSQAHLIFSISAVLWVPFFSVPLSSSSRASNLTILASTSSNACTCEGQCIQVIIVPTINWRWD